MIYIITMLIGIAAGVLVSQIILAADGRIEASDSLHYVFWVPLMLAVTLMVVR
jgi:Na+-driven multidrug efflux pump